MKLLVKLPTTGRPERFIDVFHKYVNWAGSPDTLILVSFELEDKKTLQGKYLEDIFHIARNGKCRVQFNTSAKAGTKVGAINRDMVNGFDIILVGADDMVPIIENYDLKIIEDFRQHFTGLHTDGVLFYNDGYRGNELNTIPCLGMDYYNRFGYIYNPSYKSFFCDNEFMEVANGLAKQVYIDEVVLLHEHYTNNPKISNDETYSMCEPDMQRDLAIYNKRREDWFGFKNKN